MDLSLTVGENNAWPEDWMPLFLLSFRQSGNIGAACKAAGVARGSVYEARFNLPKFRAAYDEAREDAIDSLEQEAWRRAMSTSDNLLWKMLSSLRRGTYGERIEVQLSVKQKISELAVAHELEEADILAEVDRLLQGVSDGMPVTSSPE